MKLKKVTTFGICVFITFSGFSQWNKEGHNYTSGKLGLGSSVGNGMLLINGSGNHIELVESGSTSRFIGLGSNDKLYLSSWTDINNGISIDNFGRLGIGTGTSLINGQLSINGSGNHIELVGTGSTSRFIGLGSNDKLYLSSWTDINNGISIDNFGRLGIGTGTSLINGQLSINGSGNHIELVGTGYTSRFIGLGSGDKLYIANWNDPTGGITINNIGSVGIGTTNPGSCKLAVEGKIGAHEVKVTLDGWADFVFSNDYKLKDLNEIEDFINKNKRLPEIPSESEVVESGINLGEMDAKLLQKIEELTLYMIEMNKEVKLLKQENYELKSRMENMETLQ